MISEPDSELPFKGNLNGNSESGSDIMIGLTVTPQRGHPVGRFMFKLGLLSGSESAQGCKFQSTRRPSGSQLGGPARRASLTRRSPSRNRFLR
jgi:hypothetical protein